MQTKKLTLSAVLAAIAVVIMFLEFALPFMPPFLKLDLSDIPALVGGFVMGPIAAVLIQLIKNLVHILLTQTGGIGEISNFVIGSLYAGIASLIYCRSGKQRKKAVLGLVMGSLAMVIGAMVYNYFISIPIYAQIMPMEQIIGLCGKVNPLIHDSATMILFGFLPFNLFKAVLVSVLAYIFYTKMHFLWAKAEN